MTDSRVRSWARFFICSALLWLQAEATNRYYGSYLPMGSGDNFIETVHLHGGSTDPMRKWNVECLDGEAVMGIRDTQDDFQRIQGVWCKYMFPYKPPTQGIYPYYPGCYNRNLTTQNFCYDPNDVLTRPSTFMTALYDNEFQFLVSRGPTDNTNLYKCCVVPAGYYIDYLSCYYKMTHDQYYEYYDAPFFLVFCDTGYVVTGLGKKFNPWIPTEYNLDWIQCCRVGVGPGRFPVGGGHHNSMHNYGSSYNSSYRGLEKVKLERSDSSLKNLTLNKL